MSEDTYIFTVEDRFSIDGRGVVLVPGIPWVGDFEISKGQAIKIIKPDLTEVDTFIKDVELIRFSRPVVPEERSAPILLPKDFNKFDIPVGSEVHLSNQESS